MFTKQQLWSHKTCCRKKAITRSDVKYTRCVRGVGRHRGGALLLYDYLLYITADGSNISWGKCIANVYRIQSNAAQTLMLHPNCFPIITIFFYVYIFIEPFLSVCELLQQSACIRHETQDYYEAPQRVSYGGRRKASLCAWGERHTNSIPLQQPCTWSSLYYMCICIHAYLEY